ncbi:hypothetical protein A3D88_03715 [Candidatus Peribacteria bacterium RIFCSPHIGHO2_02_FULL_52_16]|nr:MAG: hypothetical protein A2706_04530 [Candidatus Peribacteria bacterium RIFCSPHIGHO2_01_FULL_51_35]OGJ61789.1 MAG: hypothetical protein A3D88_03715 [Candidatus Peribacteria bacterium RIFCSPHIGHO2_02_FULL_52_16]
MKSFEDLDAWKVAMDLVEEIYAITRTFPKEEVFGLTSQVRRASTSIVANIAEGFCRHTYADKANRYVIARGESGEVKTYLLVALRLKIVPSDQLKRAFELVERTGKLLSGLIKSTRNL